jgi:aerobic carbon-monoxide dehydrogenase large subunit
MDTHIPGTPIGARLNRLEDPELVRGTARFVSDVPLAGALSVVFVRSPVGRARVRTLSLARARGMPGVVAVLGPRDLPVLARPMPTMNQEPDVAERTPCPLTDEVRCAGDAVAVVVADDPYRAADAAEAVDVIYDELPIIMDPRQASVDGAPLVHADVPNNIAGSFRFAMGDVDAEFARADVTLRERFSSQQVYNAALEPRGVAAWPGGGQDGVAVTLWVSTQAPQVVRRCVARALGLRTNEVRVITPYVGGGFGPKGRPYPEEIAVAAVSRYLGRPCRWEATRREDFLTSYRGHGLQIDAELAARSDGTLLGLRAHILQDAGAYMLAALIVPQYAAEHLVGPYHLPAADVQIVAVYTNKGSLAPVRGGGREQGVFVLERLMDHLARKLEIDPVELRRRNVLRAEEFPHDTRFPQRYAGTIVYDSGDPSGLLDEAVEAIDYEAVRGAQEDERSAGVYRGVAVSLFIESTAMGKEGARVEVADDGAVTLSVGSADTGQGHRTAMSQICAAELGVPPERIHFISGDTQAMGVGTGTFASRFTVMAGNATALAAREVLQRATAVASELLDVTPQALEMSDGVFHVGVDPNRKISLGEVARRAREAGTPLTTTHVFAPKSATTYAGGAHAAVVQVDIETGVVTVERYVAAHDSGTMINPTGLEAQLRGGVSIGLGQALGEAIVYDARGRLLTDSFHRYVVPRASEVPRVNVRHHPCPSRNNPVGIKGVGENGTIGGIAVIIAAVEDALAPLGLTLNEMPIRSQDLTAASEPLREAAGAFARGGVA